MPRRKNLKFQLFEDIVEIDPELYAEETCSEIDLEEADHKICNQISAGLSFDDLYMNACNIVLQKPLGAKLDTELIKTMTQHLTETAKSNIASAQGGLLLEAMNQTWLEYNTALQMIRDILMYMDPTYIIEFNTIPVHELGFNLWRENVVRTPEVKDGLLDAPSWISFTGKELVRLSTEA